MVHSWDVVLSAVRGSLITSGTFSYNGLLNFNGTLSEVGSLFYNGAFSGCGSLWHRGTLGVGGSLQWSVTYTFSSGTVMNLGSLAVDGTLYHMDGAFALDGSLVHFVTVT